MDISDRIIVMYEGEIVADVNPKEITVEELGLYMAGAKRLSLIHISGILRGVGDSKRPLYYLCITSAVNILLDILFVVVLRMGVKGTAIATVISQIISAVLVVWTLCRDDEDVYKRQIL